MTGVKTDTMACIKPMCTAVLVSYFIFSSCCIAGFEISSSK